MLPRDFNINHYRNLHYKQLNLYFNKTTNPLTENSAFTSVTDNDIINHYLTIGKRHNYIYNYSQVRIIIYSGGKTGSTTLYKSFIKLYPVGAVLHCHNNHTRPYNLIDIYNTPRHNIPPHQRSLHIISSYREPITRNLSSFFQNIHKHTNMTTQQLQTLLIPDLVKLYVDKLTLKPFENYHPHHPNGNDFSTIDNINIMSIPSQFISHNSTFQIYQGTHSFIRIVMLVFNHIDKWQQILQTHVNKKFILYPSNITHDKDIGTLYSSVKSYIQQNTLVIPKHVTDKLIELDKKHLIYFGLLS